LSTLISSIEPGALLTSKGFKQTDKSWPGVFQDYWSRASETSFSEQKPKITSASDKADKLDKATKSSAVSEPPESAEPTLI
jgi:hypothetical protein